MAGSILGPNLTRCRVSGVLNRDVKQFGKQFLFDGDPETCWNSGEGKNGQWISLELDTPAVMTAITIQFQGGFVGREAIIEAAGPNETDLKEITKVFPDDVNKSQSFQISDSSPVQRIRIAFTKTSDFFSRIVIYHLDIEGTKVER